MSDRPPALDELYAAIGHRQATTLDTIEWVFNNLGRPVETIAPDEPPCFGAIALLRFANSPANQCIFFKDIWAKTIPSRAQIERHEERPKDDGRVLTLLENLEKEFYAKHGAEDASDPVAGVDP